ncbi:GntR family transcriptional regulator [Aerococcus urinae]|uniref:GntR family transcriptional regulator n=1 Tax=Aerococcus urinae TaxID=1376 RepID=UPI00254B2ADE|nr:GntR family transcriptional regulator [Aerococcus urinae]MDK6371113.1 GntR family transcriptional regulator [Aerococcus urinae]
MSSSKGPLYVQVFDDLYKKIVEGVYPIGSFLPTEVALQEKYSVSRVTIRNAVEQLQLAGLVKKNSGIGTIIISDKKTIDLKKITSFSQENTDESSILLNFGLVDPEPKIKIQLNLNTNQLAYELIRIRCVNDKKIGLHKAYIPENRITLTKKDFELPTSSLYKMFEDEGITIAWATETIEAMLSTEKLEDILDLSSISSILYTERITYNTKNMPIEFVKMYYRGDCYKYSVELNNF